MKYLLIFAIIFLTANAIAITQSGCGTLSTEATVYTLNQSFNSSRGCFNVTANNITIDGNGFTINYSSGGILGYGIYLQGVNRTVIQNITIKEGSSTTSGKYGIYARSTGNTSIFNVSINTTGPSGYGINIAGVQDTVNSSVLYTSSYGIYHSDAGSDCKFSDNFINSSSTSLYHARARVYITNNTLFCTATCFSISSSHGIYINNSVTAYSTSTYGAIVVSSGSNSTFKQNRANSTLISYVIYPSSDANANISLDQSNLAEGLPVYYNFSLRNTIANNIDFSDFGQVICTRCYNFTYYNATIKNDGLQMSYCQNTTVNNSLIETNTGTGIYLSNNYNLSIVNSIINTTGHNHVGIYSTAPALFLKYANNTILSNGTSSHGITISTGSVTEIIDNNINISSSSSYGIYFSSAENSSITNNTVIAGAESIRLQAQSKNNTLINNSLYSAYADSVLISSAHNNYIKDTLITTPSTFTQNDGFYIAVHSTGNYIDNAFINISSASAYGIYFYNNGNNNTVINSTIITTVSSSNPIRTALSSNNFTIINTRLNSSANGNDFWLDSSNKGNITLINVTNFNNNNINILWQNGSNATVNVYSNMIVNVTDTWYGHPINQANISVYDIDGNEYNSFATRSDGLSFPIPVLLYIRNHTSGRNYTYFGNYGINVSKYPAMHNFTNLSINMTNEIMAYTNITEGGITDCRILDIPITYKLMNDIANGLSPCFDIQIDSVILDGLNHYINASTGGNGVQTINPDSDEGTGTYAAEIRNLIIDTYPVGIFSKGTDSTSDEVQAGNSNLLIVRNCNLTNTGTASIDARGGDATGANANAGKGGALQILNSSVHTVNAYGGITTGGGINGTAEANIWNQSNVLLNETTQIKIANLDNGLNGGINYFIDLKVFNEWGNILIPAISTTSTLNNTGFQIGNNSANYTIAFNNNSNITLHSIGERGFANPKVFKDGSECTGCSNFTALNDTIVRFNTTTFGSYAIANSGGALDPCNYVSGNWLAPCNCIITSNVNLNGNNLTVNGTGTFNVQANITGFNVVRFFGNDASNICIVRTSSGGGFRK